MSLQEVNLQKIADAIKYKKGSSASIAAIEFDKEILSIETGSENVSVIDPQVRYIYAPSLCKFFDFSVDNCSAEFHCFINLRGNFIKNVGMQYRFDGVDEWQEQLGGVFSEYTVSEKENFSGELSGEAKIIINGLRYAHEAISDHVFKENSHYFMRFFIVFADGTKAFADEIEIAPIWGTYFDNLLKIASAIDGKTVRYIALLNITYSAKKNLSTLGGDYYVTGDNYRGVAYTHNFSKMNIFKFLDRYGNFLFDAQYVVVYSDDATVTISENNLTSNVVYSFFSSNVNPIMNYERNRHLQCIKVAHDNLLLTITNASAFKSCTALKSFQFNDKIYRYNTSLFEGCSELISAPIPDYSSLEDNSFANAKKVSSIYIGKETKNLWSCAVGNEKIKTFVMRSMMMNRMNLTLFLALEEVIVDKRYDNALNMSQTLLKKHIINYTTRNGNSPSFSDCKSLKYVRIDSVIVSIGEQAFSGTDIDNIELPNSLKYIQSNAFRNTNISKIEIPESVVKLGSFCFYGCKNLRKVVLNFTNLVVDDDHVFENCSNLETIEVPVNFNASMNFCTAILADVDNQVVLKKECIVEIFKNLKDNTSASAKKIKLDNIIYNQLTEDELLIATQKNWIITKRT